MSAITALDSGNPDSDDESRKADKLAARAARFSSKLPGNRYKQVKDFILPLGLAQVLFSSKRCERKRGRSSRSKD